MIEQDIVGFDIRCTMPLAWAASNACANRVIHGDGLRHRDCPIAQAIRRSTDM